MVKHTLVMSILVSFLVLSSTACDAGVGTVIKNFIKDVGVCAGLLVATAALSGTAGVATFYVLKKDGTDLLTKLEEQNNQHKSQRYNIKTGDFALDCGISTNLAAILTKLHNSICNTR